MLTHVNIKGKVNIVIIIQYNHNHAHPPTITVHQPYYVMTATDKRPLISESVTATRIDIHPAGEEPDQHVIRVTHRVSRMTTVCKSLPSQNRAPALRMKSWLPVMPGPTVILGCLILPPTNHLEAGRCGSTR
jgi:hypothetical protein